MNASVTDALAPALVHFLWQGAAIAIVLGLAGPLLRRVRPQARYLMLCGALGLMAAAPTITFLIKSAHPPAGSEAAPAVAAAFPTTPLGAPVETDPSRPWRPWVVSVWLAGVAVLAARALGGWLAARRLTHRQTSPAAAALQQAARRFARALDLRRPVRLLTSAIVKVPVVVGWLRPVVLLPIGAVTSLTPAQIEMLIAHELAHVRRYDVLVNFLQTAVETLLFYHPAVWWVSGQIRAEREHCCDDLAVGVCGDVRAYAGALASLESFRAEAPALAVPASGGSLLSRIQRLAGRERIRPMTPPAWVGALLPAAAVVAALFTAAPHLAVAESAGYLRGLADAGYTKVSVDEIIELKEHGVEPDYIKKMLAAGLGPLSVDELIRLREHGVEPEFAAAISRSGLLRTVDVRSTIELRENGADGHEMERIRALGFGPYSTDEVIRLRQNGIEPSTFEALIEAGVQSSGVEGAVEFRQNGITVDRIRSMKRQGFKDLSVEQIVKLSRGGVI